MKFFFTIPILAATEAAYCARFRILSHILCQLGQVSSSI